MQNQEKTKIIMLCIIVALISFGFGFISGQYTAINWAVSQASTLLKLQGYELVVDEALITAGLIMYKEHANSFIELKGGDKNGSN